MVEPSITSNYYNHSPLQDKGLPQGSPLSIHKLIFLPTAFFSPLIPPTAMTFGAEQWDRYIT